MQANFQPSWKGDVRRESSTSNKPNKEMWGSGLKDQAIDQSSTYTKNRNQIKRKNTTDHIEFIRDLTSVKEKHQDVEDPLENMHGKLYVATSKDNNNATTTKQKTSSRPTINVNNAQMLSNATRRSSFKQDREDLRREKHNKKHGKQTTKQLYKEIMGSDKQSKGATGESMALRVVKQTARKAKIAGQNAMQKESRPTYDNLLLKVQNAEAADNNNTHGPPDLPIGLPRGRLVTTHVFLLGRKMKIEILRIGRVGVHYEAEDDEMRQYVLETTEREIYDSLSDDAQVEISTAGIPVEKQVLLLIGRLGFRVNEKDKRKKELAIMKSTNGKNKQQNNSKGPNYKGRWGKMRKLTSDIGEDMFHRRIAADSKDVASMVGLGMLKVKQNMQYEAMILFIQAVRTAQIVRTNRTTGRHELVPGANELLSEKNSVFGASFWNSIAKAAYDTYLDDLRLQVLNVALDCSEIASRFLENIANQSLWILRGRIHESLGHLQEASDLYEKCIANFTQGKSLNEVMFRAAAVSKRLGRFTRCVAYFEYALINPPTGFTQADILFQVARAHEQEGKVDIASDGFRQAFKLFRRAEEVKKKEEDAVELNSREAMKKKQNKIRSWRDWINRQDTWDIEATRSFQEGYFSISIDMIHRAIKLGERHIQLESEKPFGGECEKIYKDSSKYFWKAAVAARHLGELHTSLKACEEAVKRDPDNQIAAIALEKWNSFFIDGDKADDEDPDMMLDPNDWGKHMLLGEFNSDELKYAMEKQTKAALKMESMHSHGVEGNTKEHLWGKEVRDTRRTSRRLSVASGKSLGAAFAATAAAKEAAAIKKTKKRLTNIKENELGTENMEDVDDFMDDEEDRKRLAKKRAGFGGGQRKRRRMRPMSASAAEKGNKQARQLFMKFDRNSTGQISTLDLLSELPNVIQSPLFQKVALRAPFVLNLCKPRTYKTEIANIRSIDSDGNATINLTTFSTWMNRNINNEENEDDEQVRAACEEASKSESLRRKQQQSIIAKRFLQMQKKVGFALRRIAIMATYELDKLKARSTNITANFGFVGTIHALIATILLDEKSLVPKEIKSQDFMLAVDKITRDIDTNALMSTSSDHRPSLRDLRRSHSSPSAAAMSNSTISLLSPSGKQTLSSDASRSATATERLLRGKSSLNSHFDSILTDTKKSGGKRLDSLIEKSIHTHSIKKMIPANNLLKKSPKISPSKNRRTRRTPHNRLRRTNLGNSVFRVTKIPNGRSELNIFSKTTQKRAWKGERPRQNHSVKQRRNWLEEKRKYDSTKAQIKLMEQSLDKDGKTIKKIIDVEDPILMSRMLIDAEHVKDDNRVDPPDWRTLRSVH
tara:strand:+ start:1345 stop:5361 length:4017 start_codon:yes stop_codon:yes gene_type:complete